MAHELFRTEFVTRVRSAIVRAEEISRIEHHGLAGRAREVFMKGMLQPILPPYVELWLEEDIHPRTASALFLSIFPKRNVSISSLSS